MHIHYTSITVCRFSATLILKWNTNNDDDDYYYDDNNNNKGLRRGEGICHHPNQGHVMRIYSLSVLKTVCA